MKIKFNDRLILFGFSDDEPEEGFLIPIFTHDDNLYLQNVDKSGDVSSVSMLGGGVAVEALTGPPGEVGGKVWSCALGEPALYAFKAGQENIWLGSKQDLMRRIREWLPTSNVEPVLKLELLEFIESSPNDLADAIKAVRSYMLRAGFPQANAWAESQFENLRLADPDAQSDRRQRGTGSSMDNLSPPLFAIYLCGLDEFREILRNGKISTRKDNIFESELVHLYYGRPDYRLAQRSLHEGTLPCVIGLRAEELPSPHKVFPFDSGRFASTSEKKGDELQEYLKDFQLNASIEAGRAYVASAYGSNLAYFTGLPLSTAAGAFGVDAQERRTATEIASVSGSRQPPAVEFFFDQPVPVTAETVELLIVPEEFSLDPTIREFVELTGAKAVSFEGYHVQQPHELMPHVLRNLEAEYRDLNLFR